MKFNGLQGPFDASIARNWAAQTKEVNGQDGLVAEIVRLQTVLYVMMGCGTSGEAAMRNPKYLSLSRNIEYPYPRRAIQRVAMVITIYAEVAGLNPTNLSALMEKHETNAENFPHCFVW